MNPHLKLVLDELNRQFNGQDEKWERRFSDLDHDCAARDSMVDGRLATLEVACSNLDSIRLAHTNDDHDNRVTALEVATTDLETWRPAVEALMDDLRLEVKRISDNWDHTQGSSSTR